MAYSWIMVEDKLIKYAVFFLCADDCWIMSHLKTHLEQMMKDLIEEAERWDLEPKPASLRWTGTYASEMTGDITIYTRTGRHKILFQKSFRIPGYFFEIRQGTRRTAWKQECNVQSKAWWRDAKIYRSKVVVKCRRMVEHVHNEFLL